MSTTTKSLTDRLRAPSGPAKLGRPQWIGWGSIALAFIAFFITVPPIEVRSAAPSYVLAVAAIGVGAYAVVLKELRLGICGIVAALLCAAGAYAATKSEVSSLEAVVTWGALFAAMLRYATPLLFAALGGLVSERSGVVNIGLEGMMLTGAFFAAYGADKTGSWFVGILIGIVAGMVMGLLLGIFAITLRADQIVSGTAINFVALGLTGYMFVNTYGDNGTPDDLPKVPDINLHIGSLGFIGRALTQQNLLVWVALFAVVAVWLVIFRTKLGLRIRSVGEHPKAAETVGIDVIRLRYLAVITSGGLAAMGGAFLSIGFVHSFNQNMTNGRGFIGLAALIFGRWRPFGAMAATFLFGFSSSLAQSLSSQNTKASWLPLLQALPYVLTLIAVAGIIGRSTPPAADGIPYKREG